MLTSNHVSVAAPEPASDPLERASPAALHMRWEFANIRRGWWANTAACSDPGLEWQTAHEEAGKSAGRRMVTTPGGRPGRWPSQGQKPGGTAIGRVVDVLIRQGPQAVGVVPRGPVGRSPARNGPMVSPGRMAL